MQPSMIIEGTVEVKLNKSRRPMRQCVGEGLYWLKISLGNNRKDTSAGT